MCNETMKLCKEANIYYPHDFNFENINLENNCILLKKLCLATNVAFIMSKRVTVKPGEAFPSLTN